MILPKENRNSFSLNKKQLRVMLRESQLHFSMRKLLKQNVKVNSVKVAMKRLTFLNVFKLFVGHSRKIYKHIGGSK